jgi:hypothetical protein
MDLPNSQEKNTKKIKLESHITEKDLMLLRSIRAKREKLMIKGYKLARW